MLKARVDTTIKDPEVHFVQSIIANFHNESHTTVEVMYAIRRLQKTKTIAQIAVIFGRSRGWVESHISLMRLDESLHSLLVSKRSGVTTDINGDDEDKDVDFARGRLTFQLASIVAGLPRESQLEMAGAIIKKKMTYQEARRYVLKYIDENGIESRRRGRASSEAYQSLESATRTAVNKFGIFTDMNPAQLHSLFDSQPIGVRRTLAQQLRLLRDDLGSIAGILCPEPVKK
jgi:hypothetical protein